MKRVLLSIILALFLALPSSAAVSSWPVIAEQLLKSVVLLENKSGKCTAFVINDEKDLVLTAAHCDGDELYVDQTPAKIISKDAKKDLMVLEVPQIERPNLRLAKSNPKIGEQVASLGFGMGLERPLFRVHHISDNEVRIDQPGIGGPFLATDTTFVAGQSGGPVVNGAGEVVMICQLGSPTMGLGVGAETIRAKMGKYFAKDAPKK